ncbi:MAG: hypothetical protein IJV74_00930 [Clostridia bacterium]|nr:hypothetical protein [Clostridia bacterium]
MKWHIHAVWINEQQHSKARRSQEPLSFCNYITIVSGCLLIIIGILMASGTLGRFLSVLG